MIFIMLVLSIISFSASIQAIENVEEIRVSIVSGGDAFNESQYEIQFETLHNYCWVVNNTEYKFNATIFINNFRDEYCNTREEFLRDNVTDVLIHILSFSISY